MQEIRSSNPPVVTGISDPNKSQARHHQRVHLKKYGENIDNPSKEIESPLKLKQDTILSL